MDKDDLKIDIEMYFKQIMALADLMINEKPLESPNLFTLRDIAQIGLEHAQRL